MATNLEYIYLLKDKYSKQLATIKKRQMEFTQYYLKSMGRMNASALKHRDIVVRNKQMHNDYASRVIKNMSRINRSYDRNTQIVLRNQKINRVHQSRRIGVSGNVGRRTTGGKGGGRDGGGLAGLAGSVGGAFLVGSIVRKSIDFESQMNGIKAVGKELTKLELGIMREKAMQWGISTEFSAVKIGTAMKEAKATGMSFNEVLEAMPGNIALAAASDLGLTEAMILSTDVVNQFGLAQKENIMVANTLAMAQASSTNKIWELGEAMKNSGKMAHVAGLDVEQLSVSLMAIGETGDRGGQGGTFMSNFLRDMRAMAPKLRGALTKVFAGTGTNISDVYNEHTGKFTDFYKFIDTMRQKEGSLSIMKGAFNIRSERAMLGLLGVSQKKWDKFKRTQSDVTGAAIRMQATKMEGLPGGIKLFNSALETSQLVMMKSFVEPLSVMLRVGARFLVWLSESNPWVLKFAFVLLVLTTAIVGVGTALWISQMALGAWAIALAGAGKVIVWTLVKTGLMTTALYLQATASGIASVGILTMKGAWMLLNAVFLATPIGWVVLAIGALIGIMTLCVMKTNNMADAFKLFGGILVKTALTPLNLMIQSVWLLAEALSYLPDFMGGGFSGDIANKIDAYQDLMNKKLSGNDSWTIAGHISDIYNDEKGGSQASSWIADTTKKSAEERGMMMQNMNVKGEIKVSADQNSTVDYSNFEFDQGNNTGGT